jgi:hypothetical protein
MNNKLAQTPLTLQVTVECDRQKDEGITGRDKRGDVIVNNVHLNMKIVSHPIVDSSLSQIFLVGYEKHKVRMCPSCRKVLLRTVF